RVHHRGAFVVGEGGDGSRGVGTDPGQAQQRVHIGRDDVTVLGGDHRRRLVQPQRATRVPELAPGTQDVTLTSTGQRRRLGPALHPLLVHWKDPVDRRLLQHDLADQHPPTAIRRRLALPPRQPARVLVEPVQQQLGIHEADGTYSVTSVIAAVFTS